MDEMILFAQTRLRELADPAKAGPMAAYMKTTMPFYGVQAPARRTVARELARRFPVVDQAGYEQAVLALWGLAHREERYLAIDLAARHRTFIAPASLPLYERLVRDGAWWDLVDPVATSLVGGALAASPEQVQPVMDRWIDGADLWIRRSAILCQLGRKSATDAARLFDYCLRHGEEREFFIRKAIGWALREYAKTDPDAVRAFLGRNRDRLSPLSIREAAKHLGG